MRILCLILLLMLSFSVMAGEVIYNCHSKNGTVRLSDHGKKGIVLDLSDHSVIFMDLAYNIFADIVDPRDYAEFVLKLSRKNFIPRGGKFENSSSKTLIRAERSEDIQTCHVSFDLKKKTKNAAILYQCTTLFKVTQKMSDELDCEITPQ